MSFKNIIIFLINFYQRYLSFDRGLLMVFAPGGACKSYHSCSEYTKQMIIKEGISKGMIKGLKRIWSCR